MLFSENPENSSKIQPALQAQGRLADCFPWYFPPFFGNVRVYDLHTKAGPPGSLIIYVT